MIKKLSKSIAFVIIAILVGVTVVYAGSLTPPGAPSATSTLSMTYIPN